MDKFTITRNYEDESTLEIRVEAENEYCRIVQECFIEIKWLENLSSQTRAFITSDQQSTLVEFGRENGEYWAFGFTMNFEKEDNLGHVIVDLDMGNSDDSNRNHRCGLYVCTEYGMVLDFSKMLNDLSKVR